MAEFFTQFHFLNPWWLSGLLPLGLLWRLLWQQRNGQSSAWQKLIDPQLMPYLLVKEGAGNKPRLLLYLLAGGWVLATLALADPVWQQRPQPVYQQPDAQVIVLGLAPSMLAQDASPTRLAQARFKAEDLLRNSRGHQTGLVAYAGDAFTVTPLTTDIATLQSQLRVLEPDLMPLPGNRPDRGLRQAGELLQQAGLQYGHIILLADEAGGADSVQAAKKLAADGYQVSVLGIGTESGAPIPGQRDAEGRPVLSRVDNTALQAIAGAGNGHFAAYTSSLQDVNTILAADQQSGLNGRFRDQNQSQQASRWVENGPWLAIVLLPLAALAFRRGWLLMLAFITVSQFAAPQPVMASGWDDLWQRPDQQAAAALASQDYSTAAAIAPDATLRGAAEYLAGDYQQAIKSFEQQNNATADYNLGNALAQNGEYEEAIKAYDQALKAQPGMADAEYNRKLIEDLLKQQQAENDDNSRQEQQTAGEQKDQDRQKADSADNTQQQPRADNGKSQQNQEQQQAENGDNNPQSSTANSTDGTDTTEPDPNAANEEPAFTQAGDQQDQQQAQQAVHDAAEDALQTGQPPQEPRPAQATDTPDTLNPEQRQAMENWLRRVPDDPGGLLRRKFLYQYQQRRQQAARR
jgi:Ca-activated chloride channel family protein